MIDLALLVSRILLVAIFPISGYYKVIQWPGIVDTLAKAGLPYASYLGMLGTAAELALPVLIILGLWTRWAALGLHPLRGPVATYIGHPVWRVAPEAFFGQLMNFMKNLGMVGRSSGAGCTGPGPVRGAAIPPDKVRLTSGRSSA